MEYSAYPWERPYPFGRLFQSSPFPASDSDPAIVTPGQVHCSKLSALGRFSLPTLFQDHPQAHPNLRATLKCFRTGSLGSQFCQMVRENQSPLCQLTQTYKKMGSCSTHSPRLPIPKLDVDIPQKEYLCQIHSHRSKYPKIIVYSTEQ